MVIILPVDSFVRSKGFLEWLDHLLQIAGLVLKRITGLVIIFVLQTSVRTVGTMTTAGSTERTGTITFGLLVIRLQVRPELSSAGTAMGISGPAQR